MDIVKLISKFASDGLASLTEEEKALLGQNVGLLSVAQKGQYDKEVAEAEIEEEPTEEPKEEDEGIDEKSLKEMISKSIKESVKEGSDANLEKKMEAIAETLAEKFVAKANAQRAKAIDMGEKAPKFEGKATRDFMKALLTKDTTTLNALKTKTTTFNYTGDDARGGYLVPDELMAEVLRIAEKQYGYARREMRYLPFTGPGNGRKIPTLASSVLVTWTDEAGAKTSTNPVFSLVTQTLKKLAAIIPFSEELLEDSAINVQTLVAELFAEAVAKEEDAQFLYGTGSPWTGVLNNGSVGSVSLAAGVGVSGISFEKLVDMQDELPSGALPGAKYTMNRTVYSYLRKARADAVSASDGKGMFLLPPTKADLEGILGYPIELSDAYPGKTLTGNDKPFVTFGNMRMAAIFGDKQQIRAKLLDQATITDGDGTTTINLAEQDMIALRLEERVGYVMALPTAIVVLKTGAAS